MLLICIHPATYLSFYLPTYLSVSLSICLSVYLSLFQCIYFPISLPFTSLPLPSLILANALIAFVIIVVIVYYRDGRPKPRITGHMLHSTSCVFPLLLLLVDYHPSIFLWAASTNVACFPERLPTPVILNDCSFKR